MVKKAENRGESTESAVSQRRDATIQAMFKLKPESQTELAARLRAEREAKGGPKRGRPKKA